MTVSSTDTFLGVKIGGGMGGERVSRIKINLRDISITTICELYLILI